MESTIYNQKGEAKGKVKLPESVFGVKWNADLVHQVIVSMTSSMRRPVAHTKTRGEVRGGGKKPWQQKGTGRARHGSTRSPIWVGGGVAHGPRKDKIYDRKVNKKAKVAAFMAILSQKYRDGEVLFVDSLDFKVPKTKDARSALVSLAGVKGFEKLATKPKNAAIIAIDKKYPELMKSFANLGNVEVEEFRTVNPVSMMNHKFLVITNPAESIKMLENKIK